MFFEVENHSWKIAQTFYRRQTLFIFRIYLKDDLLLFVFFGSGQNIAFFDYCDTVGCHFTTQRNDKIFIPLTCSPLMSYLRVEKIDFAICRFSTTNADSEYAFRLAGNNNTKITSFGASVQIELASTTRYSKWTEQNRYSESPWNSDPYFPNLGQDWSLGSSCVSLPTCFWKSKVAYFNPPFVVFSFLYTPKQA